MKKFISVILILTIVSPFWLLLSLIQLEKYMLKKEIKESVLVGIDKTDLVFLKFSIDEAEHELDWEHSKEFEYNGEMYDIIDEFEKDDSVYFWCWWDFEETKLNKQLDELVRQANDFNDHNRARSEKLQNLISSFYFNNPCLSRFYIDRGENNYSRYVINIETRSLTPEIPPPRS